MIRDKNFDQIVRGTSDKNLQLKLNERTLGVNVMILGRQQYKSYFDTVKMPMREADGKYTFRTAVFDKDKVSVEDVMVKMVNGVCIDDDFVVVSSDSPFIEYIWGEKSVERVGRKDEKEEVE